MTDVNRFQTFWSIVIEIIDQFFHIFDLEPQKHWKNKLLSGEVFPRYQEWHANSVVYKTSTILENNVNNAGWMYLEYLEFLSW